MSHMLPPPQLSSPELPNVPLSILRSPPPEKETSNHTPFLKPHLPSYSAPPDRKNTATNR